MMRSITKDKKTFFKRLFAILFWILVWQIASMALNKEIILVSPIRVIETLFSIGGETAFWSSILFSMVRILGGFFIALICGILFACLAAKFTLVRYLLAPITSVIKSTPVASFIILALIFIGSKNLSMFISFLMVFPTIYTNVLEGISVCDIKMIEMAKIFHIKPLNKIMYIYLPYAMPFVLSGCRVSLGLCWKAGIAAEVIGIPTGSIGEKLYQAKLYLSTGDLFAWTVVIIIVSFIFEKLFLKLLKTLYRFILKDKNKPVGKRVSV